MFGVSSQPEPSSSRLRVTAIDGALSVSMAEGALHAVMLGTLESYLGAFAVELGHGPKALALLSTVPLLFGALAQLLAAPLSHLVGGRKRLVVIGAALQAVSGLGLSWIAWEADARFATLLTAKIAFWIAGGVIAPGWGSWMSALLEGRSRTRYFGIRSAVAHVALLVAFLATGLTLNAMRADFSTYALLFLCGALARLGSAATLAIQLDAPAMAAPPSALAHLRKAVTGSKWRVPFYLASLMFGAHLAVPFFTPYMLRELELDYRSFSLLAALSILGKALAFPFAHRLAEAWGLRRMLALSGLGVAMIPLVWSAPPSMSMLIFVHAFAGIAWAGLEYSSFQLLLDAAPDPVKTEFFSLANSLSGFAQLAGAMCGAFLLSGGLLSYRGVFLLSAVARGLPLFLLGIAVPWREIGRRLPVLSTRLDLVRPVGGALQRPVLSESRDEPKGEPEREAPNP